MKKERKLTKYLKGTSEALSVLADEIEKDGKLTKEAEELMSRIGADLLFHAKTFTF